MTEMQISASIEPVLDYQPAVIELKNSELLTSYVDKQIAKYQDLLITDESLTEAKKSRADLNKLNKALAAQRTSIKKEILKPFAEVEALLRDLENKTKQASSSIDQGVKDLEDRQRTERETILQNYLQDVIQGYPHLVLTDFAIPEDWTNKTNFTKSSGLVVGLTRTIAETFRSLERQKKTDESNLETVRAYADAKQVNPDPYLRMLTAMDYQPADIFRAIDLDIDNAKKQAEQAKLDAELKAEEEASHQQVINDVVVDTDTGERIKKVEKPVFWYYGLILTKDQKEKLDNFLVLNQIKVAGTQEKSHA